MRRTPCRRPPPELGAGILRADLPAGVDLPPLSISGQIRRGGWGLAILTTMPTVSSEMLALGRAPGDKYPRVAHRRERGGRRE